jgi:hypothetical protein
LISCNNGFKQNTLDSNDNQNTNNGKSGFGSVTPDNPLLNVDYKGRQVQGQGAGRLIFEIDQVNQALIMILPIPNEILTIIGLGKPIDFPELPGAKFTTYWGDGANNVAVRIPLKYIVRHGEFKQKPLSNYLPNGDKLPAFPDGEGASFALSVNKSATVHLYIGVSAAAVFIETPDWNKFFNCGGLPICFPLGPWEVKNEAQTEVLGYVALIAAKSQFNSGAYVTAQFPEELARFLDDHLKY